jgi:predicted enzyme related to lactoylglutathione lyase
MARNIKIIVYPVKDVERAKAFFREFLGVAPYVDSAYYVGYRLGDFEVGLDPNGAVGPIAYVDVDDITSSLQRIKQAGGKIVQDATDVGGGLLIAKVKDVDGNVVGFRQETRIS